MSGYIIFFYFYSMPFRVNPSKSFLKRYVKCKRSSFQDFLVTS